MSSSIWHKFNSKFPDIPFDVFMSRKIERYEKKNLDAKNVFEHTHNRLCHDGSHHRRIRGPESSSIVPAHQDTSSSSSPLVFPKIEIIDLTEDAEYEYMYHYVKNSLW
jgi:hypothetical protein